MENKKKRLAEWLAEKGTYIYLLAMLLLFALFHTDKMFNVVNDKWMIFQFFTLLYALALIPVVGSDVCNHVKNRPKLGLRDLDQLFALVLILAIILSTVLSGEGKRIFFTLPSERSISGLCFLACVLVYYAVRRFGVYDSFVLWAWMIGSAVIYIYGILCSCGINFMNIQDGVEERYYFLSPMGGSNVNAAYVCLMLPAIMVMYMVCRERFSQIIYSIYLCAGFLFSTFIKTESSAMAVIFAILLLGYFALERRIWFERYMCLVGLYLGSKAVIRVLLYLFPAKLYPFDGINLVLLDPRVILGEAAVWLLVYAVQRRGDDVLRRRVFGVRKYLLGTAAAAVSVFVLGVILVNVLGDAVPEGSLLSCLKITDPLFHSRGFIWRRTAEFLAEEPILDQWLGNGLGSLHKSLYSGPDREALLAYMGGAAFRDPHNEYLQILVDMGILGFIGYVGLIVTTLVKALGRWKENELQVAVVLTVSVYMVQALVNAYSIMHLPLWFIFLGLANGAMAVKQEEAHPVENREKRGRK